MSSDSEALHIAEVFYDCGALRCRYARYLSDDQMKWIKHGLFRAYHRDGTVASEGAYEHGKEHGLWRDYHKSGKLAAEGSYEDGKEKGVWRFWDEQGVAEGEEDYGVA